MKLAGDQGLVIRFFLLCYASLLRRGILVPASPSATLGTSTGGQLMPSYATQQHSRRALPYPGACYATQQHRNLLRPKIASCGGD